MGDKVKNTIKIIVSILLIFVDAMVLLFSSLGIGFLIAYVVSTYGYNFAPIAGYVITNPTTVIAFNVMIVGALLAISFHEKDYWEVVVTIAITFITTIIWILRTDAVEIFVVTLVFICFSTVLFNSLKEMRKSQILERQKREIKDKK